jgi:hypothetical protein
MNAKVAILAIFLVSSGTAAAAQAPPASEYEVKAAFLYNFAKFVEWPPEELAAPDAPLAICLLGTDPFGRTLDQIVADKQIVGHPLLVKRIKDAGQAEGCQILFVGASEPAAMARLAPMLARHGVLTVGEMEGFAQQGGVIQFVIQDNKVRFQINTVAADKAGLKISAQLLKLALSVPNQPAISGN